MSWLIGIIVCGLLSIAYGAWAIRSVMAADAGNPRMREIAGAIQEGAQAYLTRQYTTVAIVGVVIFVVLVFLLSVPVAIGFAIGAVLSAAAGFTGMLVSVRANVRVAQASSRSLGAGLGIAFRSGAVTGMLVAGLALLGVAVYYTILTRGLHYDPNSRVVIDALVALGFGASLISIFARLGGGILRPMMVLPLAIGAACVLTSVAGTFFVKLGQNQSIMGALYRGFIATAVLSLIVLLPVVWGLIDFNTPIQTTRGVVVSGWRLYVCGVIGLVITGLIIWITEYYTGVNFRPVRSIAAASVTGHGTNVIQGLAVSLEATAGPAFVIIAGILATYHLAGLFGIAIAVTTMLALAGMVVALDAFGPVTDNAGGIAEMSDLPSEVRKTTDALDAVGNTTKAVTKGYAIGSAGF